MRYPLQLAGIYLRYARSVARSYLIDAPVGRAAMVLVILAAGIGGWAAAEGPGSPSLPYAVHTFSVHHPRLRAVESVASPPTSAPTSALPMTASPGVDPGGQVVVPDQTLVATLTGPTPYFSGPSDSSPLGTIPVTWHGAPSSLPIINQASGYDEVRLAQRPNQSTGWIKQSAATVTETPYFIVVDLFTTKLTLYDNGAQVGQYPAGVGSSADPTPTGNYFIAFTARSPNAGYGPMVLATSDHSDVIQDWSDSGDAMIAIHGPLGSDAAIGSSGAHITHGCIRLHVADQEHLEGIPAGTPVVIIA